MGSIPKLPHYVPANIPKKKKAKSTLSPALWIRPTPLAAF